MLSTVLTTLQSLIQGRFIVSSFFPMLAFVTLNCAMLAWLNEPFRTLAVHTFLGVSTAKSTFLVMIGLVATAMLGYIFSAWLPGFQLLLEGRWPAWLVSYFVAVQVRQMEELEQQRFMNDELRAGLENPKVGNWSASTRVPLHTTIRPVANNVGAFIFVSTRAGMTAETPPAFPQAPETDVTDGGVVWRNVGTAPQLEVPIDNWTFRLREARKVGTTRHRGDNRFARNAAAARAVASLEAARQRNLPIPYEKLESAVMDMEDALEKYDADHPQRRTLEITRMRLKQLINYAIDHANSEDILLTNKLRFTFGLQRPAPTRMGNIANTIQSYAERRYKLNFEIFWSRMQRAIQRDKDFAPVLQQSKTQLDFLISCSVLTCIWSLLWMAIALLLGTGRLSFLLSAGGGPVIAYAWYRAAVAQYQALADVLRTSVDLFRFDLLKDLHIALPDDLPEEQTLWDTLHRIHSFYESRPLHYQHPKST